MPIYEYRCQACGSEWEDMQKISDPPTEVCPECGEIQAHRLISRTNFVLKGSGWYVTDYGKGTGGHAGETKASTKKESTSSSTSTSSSDTSSSTTTTASTSAASSSSSAVTASKD